MTANEETAATPSTSETPDVESAGEAVLIEPDDLEVHTRDADEGAEYDASEPTDTADPVFRCVVCLGPIITCHCIGVDSDERKAIDHQRRRARKLAGLDP